MTPAFKESDTVTVSVLLVSGKLHRAVHNSSVLNIFLMLRA